MARRAPPPPIPGGDSGRARARSLTRATGDATFALQDVRDSLADLRAEAERTLAEEGERLRKDSANIVAAMGLFALGQHNVLEERRRVRAALVGHERSCDKALAAHLTELRATTQDSILMEGSAETRMRAASSAVHSALVVADNVCITHIRAITDQTPNPAIDGREKTRRLV